MNEWTALFHTPSPMAHTHHCKTQHYIYIAWPAILLFYSYIVQKKITLKMCISQIPHRIYLYAWLQSWVTSWATVSQRSTAWISWQAKESLFHHSDSKSKKWSTEADKEADQNKVLSQQNYGNRLLVHRGTYWLTCCLEGINHCHFLNFDTEKIVTCTSQQAPNEETYHLSAWLMTSPIHLMLGVTGKVQLWSSPPSSSQFRLGLITLHTTCSWSWNVTWCNRTTRTENCVYAVTE